MISYTASPFVVSVALKRLVSSDGKPFCRYSGTKEVD